MVQLEAVLYDPALFVLERLRAIKSPGEGEPSLLAGRHDLFGADMGQRTPEPRDQEIAKRLRALRQQHGWSQAELGAVLGITAQQVQKYERAVNRITAGRLARIAETFGVPTAFFYVDDEEHRSMPETNSAVLAFDLLRTHGALRLVRAYSRISDPGVRGSLLNLAESLAANQVASATSQSSAVVPVQRSQKLTSPEPS